jgi:DNA primase
MELISLLESVLGSSERKNRGNYRFKCPLPGCSSVQKKLEIQIDESFPKFNQWKCWVCLQGGGSIRSLFKKIHVEKEKIQVLDSIIKPNKSWDRENEILYSTLELPKEFKSFNNLKTFDIIGRQAKAYLHKRGFSDDDILKYSLGYCEEGRYHHRIIFPSFDSGGLLNYYTGRSFIDDEKFRYLNPEYPRKDIVPFELYINWNAPIILCEGFFDAKAIARNAVPLIEKGITEGIMKKLMLSSTKKIYIALDKDGIKEALDYAEMLIDNGKKVYLVELEDKDPDKMGFEAFTRMVHSAKSMSREQFISRKLRYKLYE